MFPSGLSRCVTTEHRHILRTYIALMALSTASIIMPTSAASLPSLCRGRAYMGTSRESSAWIRAENVKFAA